MRGFRLPMETRGATMRFAEPDFEGELSHAQGNHRRRRQTSCHRSHIIASKNLADVVLIDVAEGLPQGKRST